MALINDIKTVLRISNTAYDTEIADLILAAKADLGYSGVYNISETDALIKRAISLYVKAHFGWANSEAEKLLQSYEMLKHHLALSLDYAFYAVTFVVKTGNTAITEAEVTLNDETLLTNTTGTAIFYVRSGMYKYTVVANGYTSIAETIVDIAASQTINISLVVV